MRYYSAPSSNIKSKGIPHMDMSKSILLASAVLSIVITLNFHIYKQEKALDRQESACTHLFNDIGDSIYTKSHLVNLYLRKELKEEITKGIQFAERAHNVSVVQCLGRAQ